MTSHDAPGARRWAARCAVMATSIAVGMLAALPAVAQPAPGFVTAWGANDEGQATVPDDLDTVAAVSAGFEHTLALHADGTVQAWGHNVRGVTEVPDDLEEVGAVSAGTRHSLALHIDGTVTAWGSNRSGQLDIPDDLADVTAVSAGRLHNLVLLADGTVRAWGTDTDGQTEVPDGLEDVAGIAAGRTHSMAVTDDGAVREWGAPSAIGDEDDEPVEHPDELPVITAVAAGAAHSLALDEDGFVHAWGYDTDGQLAVPSGLEDVVQISAGSRHSLALTSDGAVHAWGATEDWWIDLVEGVTSIAGGGAHSVTVQDTPFQNAELLERLSGDGRITTAIDISRAGFGDEGAQVVVLARADDYPDALTGTALATGQSGPLLLTASDELLTPVAREVRRVLPRGGTVHLLGGTSALDARVAEVLEDMGFEARRISGATRFETAAEVAAHVGADDGPVMIATGLDYPDALTAATAGGVVVLSAGGEPHPATDAFLDDVDGDRYAVGAPAGEAYPDAEELSGPTREGTAVAFAEAFFEAPRAFALARRDAFPDALAGGAHVSRHSGPLLLSYPGTLSEETADYLCAHQRDLRRGWVYGGLSAISPDARDHAADLIAEECER